MKSRNLCAIAVIVLITIAVGRIVATHAVFSRTADEGAHIAAGMEWLDRGTYTYEYQHPPLARVAVAFAPYLSGSRTMGQPDMVTEGDAIIYQKGIHSHTLSLARSGVLLFFVIASIFVWIWSRELFGTGVALTATVFFTTLPPILAHSGLATTDMALTAALTAALFALFKWLQKPTLFRSLLLGGAIGLAVLSKFSAILFFPVCGAALIGLHLVSDRRSGLHETLPVRSITLRVMVIGCAALFMLWAGYRFSVNSFAHARLYARVGIEELVTSENNLFRVYQKMEHVPFPFTEIFYGILRLKQHNRMGHDSYLLGENRTHGWWYFFPVGFMVKTPLPFILLMGIGSMVLLYRFWHNRVWEQVTPAACALLIFLVSIPSNINIGLRHILPIYPYLCMLAGLGVVFLFTKVAPKRLGVTVGLLLIGWQGMNGLLAHPDYLGHFNELAGRHPERILINSDLDWGQDAYRLCDTLETMDIQQMSVAVRYHPAELFAVNPQIQIRNLRPNRKVTGWIAISAGILFRKPGYEWLQTHIPQMTVGKSIYLYYLPEKMS